MSFTDEQKAALRTLVDLWSAERFVVIGAAALAQQTAMAWRQTDDLDLAVAVDLDDYPAGLDQLDDWRPDPKQEQRWLTPSMRIDVVPAGPSLLSQGSLTWPRSGHRMNLVGLDLAFAHWRPVEIAPTLSVRVATVPVVVLLKMAAYLDRPAQRERDLEDLAHLLAFYLHDSDRRFSDPILELELDFELTTAYLLGQDVGALLDEPHRQLVDAFLAALDDPVTYARMVHLGPSPHHPDGLERLLDAFRTGLATR